MKAKDLEEQLAAIAKSAKPLRDAGVVGRVTVGDISFDLGDGGSDTPSLVQTPAPEVANPLDDRDTFGGRLPRRRNAPRTEEDED